MMKGVGLVVILLLVAILAIGCGSTPEPTPALVVTPRPPAPTPTTPAAPTPAAEPTSTPVPMAIVTADALNLRAGPGTEYDRLGLVRLDDELRVVGRNEAGDWIAVVAPGGINAWVAAEYTILNVKVESLPIAPIPE
jgi:uncharacterized protein YgiM (DUF1202 family)